MNKSTMRIRLAALLLAATLPIVAMSAAMAAGITLNGIRVGAKDVTALAKFYQSAFGMFEVQRIQNPQMLEIMLDFGATAEAAKANAGADVVIMQRAADDGADTMAHLIFTVTDMDAVVKAIKAAGGKMERDPFEYGNTGIRIGMGIDPAGNHFEMLQFAKR
ncbi:MAG TPA: VOC family protein [Steroidobacteraceae bacterium]|nr:VOC family protein [Steroidobacteraceae bacterium]